MSNAGKKSTIEQKLEIGGQRIGGQVNKLPAGDGNCSKELFLAKLGQVDHRLPKCHLLQHNQYIFKIPLLIKGLLKEMFLRDI